VVQLFGESDYARSWAGNYDEWLETILPPLPDPGMVAARLSEWAAPGPVLELGIGTGRIALRLQELGREVHGVDASEEMLQALRRKPGGAEIQSQVQTMSQLSLPPNTYGLVYVVFNTIFGIPTQAGQVDCFRRVAAALAPGGRFVVEAYVPDQTRFVQGQFARTARVSEEFCLLEMGTHQRAEQRVDAAYVLLSPKGLEIKSVPMRYAYPAELDLMAQLAGLRLAHRQGNWHGGEFDDGSPVHISVYEVAP
jgi:SAM-dependent methyltransferase